MIFKINLIRIGRESEISFSLPLWVCGWVYSSYCMHAMGIASVSVGVYMHVLYKYIYMCVCACIACVCIYEHDM